MKYKCFNFKLDVNSRIMFIKQAREEFGYTIKEGIEYLDNLLNKEFTVIEQHEYDFLISTKCLVFDVKIIGKDHPMYTTKTKAEYWFDTLNEKEKEYVKELAFLFNPITQG